MTCFAVYDTNVLLSALPSNHDDAAAVQIIDRITTGEIIPLVSPELLSDYRTELHERRCHVSEQAVDYFLGVIEKYAMMVNPSQIEDLALIGFDLPFYEVVMRKKERTDYTIERHVRRLPRRPDIITAAEMLDMLDKAM